MISGKEKGSDSFAPFMFLSPLVLQPTCESYEISVGPLGVRVGGDAGAHEDGDEAAEEDHPHGDAQTHGVVPT